MERKCKDCKHYKVCIWAEGCQYNASGCIHFLDNDRDKPRTNRQWLESLSDEELAKVLDNFDSSCCFCALRSEEVGCVCYVEDCIQGIIKWLQAEHKE